MKIPRLQIALVALSGLGGFGLAASARADGAADGAFRMMDTNGDGKISAEEHAAVAKRMFEVMDADKDGKVTASEMDAAHERMGKMMGSAGKPAHTEMSSADKIKTMDTNHDGVLSADEHAAGARMMFAKMDTDKDGYLSRSELEAGHARFMSKSAEKPSEAAPEKASGRASQKTEP